jgi:hypothetical protein
VSIEPTILPKAFVIEFRTRALVGELTTIMTKERRARDSPCENRQKAAARSEQKAVETKAMINSTLDVQDH